MVYLLTKMSAREYLAGQSRIEATVGRVLIIACPEQEADWQLGRLASGLQHVTREQYRDLETAREAAERHAC